MEASRREGREGEWNVGVLPEEGGCEGVTLGFDANLLKEVLSVMGGKTRGSNTWTRAVDLVRES